MCDHLGMDQPLPLPNRIRALRVERRLSQGDLCQRAQVTMYALGRWEVGKALPRLEEAVRLAQALAVPLDALGLAEQVLRRSQP
jgi:transcriptional regulator with XRE-family HTH domain